MLFKIKKKDEIQVIRTRDISAITTPMRLTDNEYNFAIDVNCPGNKYSSKRIFSTKYQTYSDCELAYEAFLSFIHSYELSYNKYIHSSEIFLQGVSIPTQTVDWKTKKLINANFVLTPGFIPEIKI